MTMLLQQLAVGVIVVAALGHLLWRLRVRWYGTRRAKAVGCSTCDGCGNCAPAPQKVHDVPAPADRSAG